MPARARRAITLCASARTNTTPLPQPTPRLGVFGIKAFGDITWYVPYRTSVLQITDGTSNTLLMSELIINQQRGDILNDQGAPYFMGNLTPNSSSADSAYWCNTTNADYDPKLPCTNTGNGNWWLAARSRHTGGVNAARADGSVAFYSNSVSSANWAALTSMNGGETINDN
ncbi:MAG TPA: DUF1559 domain-containing protein [Gemmata sp.]